MAESRLPDEVRDLLQNHVPSIVHLDALLWLSGAPEASPTAGEVAAGIGAEPEAAARALRELAASGLAACDEGGGETRFRFAPRNAALRYAAGTLTGMYRRFPVQVIRAVYERMGPRT
jgi:DNA-binding IclR family transcriptional regulator